MVVDKADIRTPFDQFDGFVDPRKCYHPFRLIAQASFSSAHITYIPKFTRSAVFWSLACIYGSMFGRRSRNGV